MSFGSNGVEFVFGPAVFNSSAGSDEDLGRTGAAELVEYTAALSLMSEHGCFQLDNARAYGGGLAEHDMGAALAALPAAVRDQMSEHVHTKVTPGAIDLPTKTGLGLSYDKITASFETSFEQLGIPQVDIFYLHSVPTEEQANTTVLEETLRAMNDLHKRGRFRRFGVSNFPAWGVMQVYYKCKELGYVLPTVYQGQYNPLTRQVEQEVFPCLRQLGMPFYAYSPLAAGVLATSGGRSSAQLEDKPSDPATGRRGEPAVSSSARVHVPAGLPFRSMTTCNSCACPAGAARGQGRDPYRVRGQRPRP
jgi:aflatoxin B1 aldehyde reductase